MTRLLPAIGVFVLAFALRLWVFDGMDTYPRFELIKNRLDDQVTFYLWAESMAAGKTYDFSATEHEFAHWAAARPGVYPQAPLYPMGLSLLIRAGLGLDAIRIFQFLLGSLTAALICCLAGHLMSPAAAFVCGSAAACYGPWIFYESTFLRVGPINFLAAVGLYAAYRLDRDYSMWSAGRHWLAVLTGAVLGLGILMRPNFLLPALAMVLWIALREHRAEGRPGRQGLWLLTTTLIPVLAISGLNTARSGQLAFVSSNGPYNFYLGNVHDAHGATASTTPTYLELKASAPADQIDLTREGLREIAGHPKAWLKLTLRKILMFLGPQELPNNLSWPMARKTNLRLEPTLEYAHLMGFALIGLALSLARGQRLERFGLLYLFAAGYAAATIPFMVPSRLRQPMVLVMILFAGLAFDALWQRLRNIEVIGRNIGGNRSAQALALGICLAAVWWIPTDSTLRPADFQMAAAAEFSKAHALDAVGNPAEALDHYRQAVALFPDHRQALGRVLALAVPSDRRDPLAAKLCDQARGLLEKPRKEPADWRQAERLLTRAGRIDPFDPLPFRYLANLHFLREDRARAAEALEEAIRRAPWQADLRQNLLALRFGGP